LKNSIFRILRRISLGGAFLSLILVFLFIILYSQMVHTIPVAHTAVLWHRINFLWKNQSEGPLAEGVKIILPWDKLFPYDLRIQTRQQAYQVVSKDGLHFTMKLSFRWSAVGRNIVALNQTLGPNYVEKLIIPELGSTTREIVAQYSAEDLYSSKRATVQKAIFDTVTDDSILNGIRPAQEIDPNHKDVVDLVDILIEKIELPSQIQTAIQNKLEQAQIAQEYEFRLQRERLESDRKLIEAEGIRDFQKTVAPAITESYLRWRGIEATLKLAESENSKVVVIGNSATGLPLILDTNSASALPEPDVSKLFNQTPRSEQNTTVSGQILPTDGPHAIKRSMPNVQSEVDPKAVPKTTR